jgi:hypothetical protein
MKKAMMILAVLTVVFTVLAVAAAPTAQGDGSAKSYWVHYYHTYSYHTYYTPVIYRPVYVAPVVYPVYTYHYWYYKFAGR